MTIILAPSTKTKFVFAFGKLKFAFEFAPETVQVFKMSLLITMSLLIKCCSKTHDQKQIAKIIVPRRIPCAERLLWQFVFHRVFWNNILKNLNVQGSFRPALNL